MSSNRSEGKILLSKSSKKEDSEDNLRKSDNKTNLESPYECGRPNCPNCDPALSEIVAR